MKISQGNSQCRYLYLNKQECNFFFFSLLSSTKLEKRRAEKVLPRRGFDSSWWGKRWEKWVGE
jgi:hypothetical protein